MQHPQYPYLLGNQMGALFALIWRIKGPLILWRHLGDITWFLEAWILKYIWSKLERGARMHHFWEDHQAVKNVMEREKTLEPTASFSLLHRISHLFYNHGFQVVSSRQKCTSCMSLVFLMPRYRPGGPSPHWLQPSFFLGMGFPWSRAPKEDSCIFLTYTGTAPHYFSGNLIHHSPPPQRFCTGRDQNTGANKSIFHHFSDFFEHRKEENITLTHEWLQARELLDVIISQCSSQPFFQLHPVGFKADLVSAALWGPQEVLTYQVFSTSSNTKG